MMQKRLTTLGTPASNFLVFSRDQLHMQRVPMPDLGEPAGRESLDQIIDRENIGLVILDSLSTLVRSGIENDAESWAPIQDWAMGHRWQGRTMIFVHHEGKGGKPRGTSKREDVLDTMIGLKARPDLAGDEDAAFELIFTKSRAFYGKAAAPLLVRLSTATGTAKWTSQTALQNTRDRVSEMLKQGYKPIDIAKQLGLSRGRILQIVKEMKSAS
jgi:putative DNA primase/helicase